MINLLKWSSLKRHAALPLAVIVSLTIVLIISEIYGAKEAGTYEIKHWHGNAAVLEEITVSGSIVDYYHKTHFQWQANDVSIHTDINQYPTIERRYQYTIDHRSGNYYYHAYEPSFGTEYAVRRYLYDQDKGRVEHTDYATVNVSLQRKYNVASLDSPLYVNPMHYGLAEIDDDIYYTIVASQHFSGSNGIYKLSFLPQGSRQLPYMQPPDEPIIEYDMNNSIDVLGLEAVGDKLALITLQEDQLVITAYQVTGEELGSVSAAPIIISNNITENDRDKLYYYPQYESYVNADNDLLSLSFLTKDQTRKVINISFAGSPRIEAVTEIDTVINSETKRYVEEQDYEFGSRFMTHKDGKLYYASVYRQMNEDESRITASFKPAHFILSVYEHGQLLYRGELVTNMNDDLIRLQHRNMMNYGFDRFEYRNIYDVYME